MLMRKAADGLTYWYTLRAKTNAAVDSTIRLSYRFVMWLRCA